MLSTVDFDFDLGEFFRWKPLPRGVTGDEEGESLLGEALFCGDAGDGSDGVALAVNETLPGEVLALKS